MTITNFKHGVAWEESYGYSQGFLAGDTLYVSGQLAHNEACELVGEDDMAAQAEQTFANLDKVLDAFGATRNQVVETTVMIIGLREHFGAVSEAHLGYFGTHHPASTALGVVDLAMPGQILEVSATVRLDLPK